MHWQLIILLLAAALLTVVVYGVLGLALPKRWRKSEGEEDEDFTIDSVNVLIGLLFSILLAFVIAGVLSDFDEASQTAQDEANAVGAIYGFGQGISEPDKSIWKRDSRNYAKLVVDEDWPLMNKQQPEASPAAWAELNALRDHIVAFVPTRPLEQSLQEKAIDKVQGIYDARRMRVDLVNAGVPDFMWYSLIGGGILVALFPLLTKPRPTGRLLIAVVIQSLIITVSLYLVNEYNNPFSGDLRVGSDAFEILISRLDSSP